MITANKLVSEINKALPSYRSSVFAVVSSQEERTVFVRTSDVTTIRNFEEIIEKVKQHLAKLSYFDETKSMITYKTNILNQPLLDGFYICFWDTPKQHQLAMKVDLTLRMEELLNLQKTVLAKKQELLSVSKLMLENKQKHNL